ncbi:Smr/MutS family protein [bacterium]|nr:Smr/MutS family protein [bacterium]
MSSSQQYASLEFDRLLSRISGFAGSELTRGLIKSVDVVFHPSRIEQNLDQTEEYIRFVDSNPSIERPDFGRLEDLTALWAAMASGAQIDQAEARQLIRFFALTQQFEQWRRHFSLQRYPRLSEVWAAWQGLDDLVSLTGRVFNEDGEVRDSASPELDRLRQKLRRFESEVANSLRDVLSSVEQHSGDKPMVTIRSNRFVVVMPRGMAGSFKGSIVDVSGSGQSIYFEPQQVSQLNSERQHLFIQEAQEVGRILRDYAMQVAQRRQVLGSNLAILAQTDFVIARARFSRSINGNRPQIVPGGGYRLEKAVHPLLHGEFIPEDLYFENEKALVVSGVNAGGKTVLLKLMGIYSLMACLGCFVPGQATLPVISGIMADIGDDQSTIANLSTFTGHLHFISELWKQLGEMRERDYPLLVLIDEIGTGTEPSEGSAFAYGLIRALLEHPVLVAVTTHYDLLKTLGFERSEVKNVSLEFDQQALKATYRVLDGQPGSSYALKIARNWGIDPSVLSIAESVIGEEAGRMSGAIGEIELLRREADEQRAEAGRQTAELTRLRDENAALNADLLEARRKVSKQAEQLKQRLEERMDELLRTTNKKLRERTRKSVKKQDDYVKAASKTARIANLRKAEFGEEFQRILEEHELPVQTVAVPDRELRVGDQVMIEGSALRGELLEFTKNGKECNINVGGKKLTIKVGKLSLAPGQNDSTRQAGALHYIDRARSRAERNFREGTAESSDTIDLHGHTVEEATAELDVFISQCLLANIHTIRVMHGVGTGRLRTFVQGYLKRHGNVGNVRFAEINDGGVGVTVADLH